MGTQEKTRRCWLLGKARPPLSVNLGIGIGCQKRGSQPANGGSFLRSCGWRRQSSEVLYVTYQHGLPFNQRVERKDKVKPSSPGSANRSYSKAMKGRQESETHCSIRFKKVDRVIWSEGMFQSDLGKMAVECFSNLCSNAGKALQHHLSDRCSHTWMCPRQINQVLFRKCNHLKLVQRIFSPGLVALVAHMTAHCCVVGQ